MGHETSPDSLKNTSTNIARLEDVIEHCEGRKKYHSQTMSPSDGADVRWYFCEVPLGLNELAASAPRTEIVGKSDYFRFGRRDSLAIEASFLQREEELLSYWWREYAECYEAPKGLSKTVDFSPSSKGAYVEEIYPTEEERLGVPVKGGLYEVDLVKRQCFPVYWGGENRRVLRGHWFARKGGLDWLPLREDVSEQLEYAYRCRVWHRRMFQPSGLFAARVDLQGSTPGLHALFTGEDESWEAWLSIDAFSFLGGVYPRGNTVKLRRGYSIPDSVKPSQDELRQRKEEEMDDYCSQVPVKHLIFMVHGIGQRLERSNLIDDVGTFRNITTRLAELHLTPYQRLTQRVLFIPCQWRRGLRLSGEAAVEKITLDGVRGLRVMLSATVHDVLYYMSPIYCQDIINSVTNQLNMLYLKFIKRNPGYDGKVSLYAHSLGSVLSYDILCHQENLSSPFAMDSVYKYLEDDNRNAGILSDMSMHRDDLREPPTRASVTSDDRMEVTDAASSAKFSAVCGDCFEAVSREVESDTSLGELIDTTEGCSSENVTHEVVEDTVSVNELLREIDVLKAKVAKLELKCASKGGGSMEGDLAEQKHDIVSHVSVCQQSYTPYIKYQKLEFEVDTFFAVGSPLGVFLALRNVRIGIGMGKEYWSGENIDEEMPACGKMFNIFHPFDPVAYRLEPLICKEYLGKRPVFVPYHKGGKRLHISIQDFTDEISARSGAVILRLKSVREKILTTCQARDLDDSESDTDVATSVEKSYGSIMMKRLTGEDGRIDYMLQDKTFQHAYISAIGSHMNYWRDYDTALFILKHLYRDIPPQKPHSSDPSSPLAHPGNADEAVPEPSSG